MRKLTPIIIQKEINSKDITIFSIKYFSKIFSVNNKKAGDFISKHAKKGNFIRIKRGVYFSPFNPPSKLEIANYLVKPSYISFETALSYYNIIPETVYTITSATTSRPKEYEVQKQEYKFHKIKKELFFGYEPVQIRGRLILMATPEKALLDYLYISSLKKSSINSRLDLSKIDKKEFKKFFVSYFKQKIRKNKPLINLIKNIYDN